MVEMIGDSAKKEEKLFALITLLREGTLNFRWRAAEMLGDEGDLRAVGPLIEALHDPYTDVSWIAAKSLGKLGDPEAVPHLIELLKSEDTWNRFGAVIGLGTLGDPRAVEPLAEVLRSDQRRKVREKAAWALGKIGGEASQRVLEAWTDEEDDAVKKAVSKAIDAIKQNPAAK
jgi:HEAT repeat protein